MGYPHGTPQVIDEEKTRVDGGAGVETMRPSRGARLGKPMWCSNLWISILKTKDILREPILGVLGCLVFFLGMPVQWKGFGWLDYSSVGCADLEQHADSCHRWFGDEKPSKNEAFLDGSSGFTVTTCVPVKHSRSQRPRTRDFGRWEAQMLHTSHEQWGFPIHGGTPIAGWLIMEIPTSVDDLGVPFRETSIHT